MGIMQGLRKKERGNSRGGAATSAPKTPRKMHEAAAPLMLMLPDAAGIAAYQLNEFPSPKAAEFFIDSTLRGTMPESAVMFWALNWEPKGVAAAEPLVLIRDGENIVYPFSFSDLESAFQFVRHEMQRGLHLFQVMIYWAIPARAEADFWGRATIVPPQAPRRGMSVVEPSDIQDVIEGNSNSVVAPTVVPQIEAPAIDDDSERFLQDEDIADAVRQANHVATHAAPGVPEVNGNVVPMPAPAPSSRKSKSQPSGIDVEPIDFASASQKVGESRTTRSAINAWSNFAQAVDEALDVYVARQVATKLAWNRLSRALGHAIETKRRVDVEEAERKAPQTAARAEEVRREADRLAAAEAARIEAEKLAAAEAARVTAARKAAKLRGLIFAWRNGSVAMADSVHALQYDTMVRRSWAVGTVELASAAKTAGKRKAMRKAWLNAAWTLEEAAYAYVLEQKSRAIRAWRIGSIGIAEAVTARLAYEGALRRAWSNAGVAIGQAHRVHVARLRMLQHSWAVSSQQIHIAVLTRQRMIRVRTGLNNFSIALEEAVEAKAYRDEMIDVWQVAIDGLLSAVEAKEYCDMMSEAWSNVAFALEGVCRAYIRKQERAIRAWGRLGTAFGSALKAKMEQDAAIEAWTNISLALQDAVFAKQRHLGLIAAWGAGSAVLSDSARRKFRGLVFAWTSASAVVTEAVIARKAYEAAVAAWTNASNAIGEAAVACARYWFFVDAWENAGCAMGEAVEAYLAWKAALESAWEALTFAFEDAVLAKMFRDRSIAAWSNATVGIGEMVHAFVVRRMLVRYWQNAGLAIAEAVPAHLFKEQSIAAWQTAGIAFKQAAVTEAKLRIAAAKLDRKQMATVDKLVKAATTKAPRSRKSRATDTPDTTEIGPEPFIPPLSRSHVMLMDEFLPKDFDDGFDDPRDALLVEEDDDATTADLFEDDTDKEQLSEAKKLALFPGLWRNHEAGRWRPREEPFSGFKSPSGRFHHMERNDRGLP